MSNADWEPEHRIILALDIEGFGSTMRTDPIRAGLRRSLAALTADAIRRLDGEVQCAVGDTGDGMWIIFPGEISKLSVLTKFVPALEVELRHYNAVASEVARLRLRIGVHHGDIIRDESGYVGEALNHVFRIIDNDIAREALRGSPDDSVTVISDDLYNKIIKHGYGALDPRQFLPVRIHVKETAATAWIKSSQVMAGPEAAAIASKTSSTQQILTLSDLSPSALYVPLAEVHNAALYAMDHPEPPICQHIEVSLLFADKVVIHCADPYRSTQVASIIKSLEPCVIAGDLLFLLSKNAYPPSKYFRSYIDTRIDQYKKSKYGAKDVESLTNVAPDAAETAERLLDLSPTALIRGFSGAEGFVQMAIRDLQPSEPITIREHFFASILSRMSLSVRQLMDLTQQATDGALHRIIADDAAVGRLQSEVTRLANHESFSRPTLMGAIRMATGLESGDPLYHVFEERVSLVHLMGTIGKLQHLEVTNRRDRRSPYYYGHMLNHLSILADTPRPATFGAELVMELRALPNWWYFAAYHLRLVSDMLHRLTRGEQSTDLMATFRWSSRMPEFDSISSIVRNNWR